MAKDTVYEDVLVCSDPDCEGELIVHSVTESDTGQSYYTSDCEDAVIKGCSICGLPWKEGTGGSVYHPEPDPDDERERREDR
jgi:hypothetical protein